MTPLSLELAAETGICWIGDVFLVQNIPWVSQRRFRNLHRCLLGCQKCLVRVLLVLHNVKIKLFSLLYPLCLLPTRIVVKSFHVFFEARTHRSWIHVGVQRSVIQVCIETSHFPKIEELLVANVKSRIGLNKRLHYTLVTLHTSPFTIVLYENPVTLFLSVLTLISHLIIL